MQKHLCYFPFRRSFSIHCLVKPVPFAVLSGQNRRRWGAFKILTGKPIGKVPIGRSRRGLEDNIRIYLKEISVSMRNWIDSVQDRNY